MGRYIKSNTNYIKRGKHQTVNGATIYERDWVTNRGARLNFGKGKTPIWTEGSFVFTTSNVKSYQKRHLLTRDTIVYTYDDVKNASDLASSVKPNLQSNDIRDFVYYGSCIELIRASIEHIISEFPAMAWASAEMLDYPPETEDDDFTTVKVRSGNDGYIIANPFNIDFYHKNIDVNEELNELRFLSLSYDKYLLKGKKVTGIEIEERWNKDCPSHDQWYLKKDSVVDVIIQSEGGNITIYGYKVENSIIFLTDDADFELKPQEEYIEDYFQNLDGFESILLNRKSKPLYTNTFITPIEGKLYYKNIELKYTWPSKDYCIMINTPTYEVFVNNLYKLGQTMDELWTDNLYKNMTHEAIKNFDWTYTRSYIEGEEQNNVEGGERMKNILHIIGRVFDDVKRNIDVLKNTHNANYSSYGCGPDSLLTDNLELGGWDIISTIPYFFDKILENGKTVNDLYLTKDFLEEEGYKWYPSKNVEEVTSQTVDVDFMRKLLLSSKRILNTKGTTNAVDMVMAMFGFGRADETNPDYTLTELYYKINPLKYKFDEHAEILEGINERKNLPRYDDDDMFSGLPLKDIFFGYKDIEIIDDEKKIDHSHYIIPYYDINKTYDADFTFQSKGGWGKIVPDGKDYDNDNNGMDYMETVSYLHVVSRISDLFNVNPMSVNDGDIFYVANIMDYLEYYSNEDNMLDETALTHFFKLYDSNTPELFSSWINVSVTDGVNVFVEDDFELNKKQVLYLDSIISNNLGNNPHVGYGQYDDGNTYIDNMLHPFKYHDEENKLMYDDYETALEYDWGDSFSVLTDNDKIKQLPIILLEEKRKDASLEYYLNSKVLILENIVGKDNPLFVQYFFNVILPYVMQVIPSTTILILNGFDIKKEEETE